MKTCISLVRNEFNSAIKKAFPQIEASASVLSANPKFGDYQCNSAMSLFKKHANELGDVKSPNEIALKIKDHLDMQMFESIAVSQGFVTVKLSTSWIKNEIENIFNYGMDLKADKPLKILVDYSHPNIAKEMHVGHLRSTIIGNSIYKILDRLGHTVLRINHIGDWGTQFGMLIEYLMREYSDYKTSTPVIRDLEQMYRKSKQRFDTEEDFKKASQLNVVKLQSGDETAVSIWKKICEISRIEFQKVYDKLDVELEEVGESFYNSMLPGISKEVVDLGLAVESDGAKCIFIPGYKVPLMVVKSDGGYTYDTTDLASIKYRINETKADWILYVVDSGQEEHFKKLFAAAKLAGWYKEDGKPRLEFIGFGVVLGENGKRLKTRAGDAVKLTEMLDEASRRAYEELKRRKLNSNKESTTAEEVDDEICFYKCEDDYKKASECIGYSAVKYYELKQNRLSCYKFSYDKILDPKGNTAVYMLYAYARICAIFRKSQIKVKDIKSSEFLIENKEVRALAIAIVRLPDVIESIIQDFFVNRLAEYMYEITELFTQFYKQHKVLNSPTQNSRLILCEVTRNTLKLCFDFLGIKPLEQI